MRIRKVTAHAFGPLAGQTLELAEGLTVVWGPNESAKSSWHAAITAALCGLRRGPKTAEDKDFERRHRPWDSPAWEVSAEIVLADGRRVELRHDLAGGVACYAKDLDVGKDYSAELIKGPHEVPDAARWLGLDRRTFRATASVAQAQLDDVVQRADALQEHLQRAASTAGADEPAAVALGRIEAFRQDKVGGPTATTRPYRRALDEDGAAQASLATARADHAELERRSLAVGELRSAADAARHKVRRQEARVARAAAAQWRDRAAEASELTRLLETAAPADDDGAVAEVSAALAAWRSLPDSPQRAARAAPPGVGDDELRELARVLAAPPPVPRSPDRVPAATARLDQLVRAGRRATVVLVVGLVVLAGAGAAAALAPPALAVGLAGLGIALALVGLLLPGGAMRGRGGLTTARVELEQSRIEAAAHERIAAAASAERAAAHARCAELGLTADPEVLHLLASGQAGAQRDEEWQRELAAARDRLGARVRAAAALVGVAVGTDVEATIPALATWLDAEPDRAAQRNRIREWRSRLNHVLDGLTLAELRQRADEAARRLELRDDADAAADEPDDAGGDEDEVDEVALRREAEELAEHAVRAETDLVAWQRTITPVAEAEERAATAAAELSRVRDLDRVLSLTRDFLSHAQDRVNRAIAPRLAAAVGRDIAAVTAGRYREAIVDPTTLEVQVRDPSGRLRDAGRLSFGTTEQVYLLLRVALAEHLVRGGESCPLLLDDVTVHADAERTREIMELLLGVAQRHQVVVFSQQEQVRQWAAERLDEPRHALRELTPVHYGLN